PEPLSLPGPSRPLAIPVVGLPTPLLQWHARLPAQVLLCLGDVRLAPRRVIRKQQRPVLDGRAAAGERDHQLRELQDRELAWVPDVKDLPLGIIRKLRGEQPAPQIGYVAEPP